VDAHDPFAALFVCICTMVSMPFSLVVVCPYKEVILYTEYHVANDQRREVSLSFNVIWNGPISFEV
jgi:hypothetical protein